MVNILQWNINGVKNHLNELTVKLRDINPKIICIQESHLKEEENFILKGFNTVRNDFTGGEEACGGVAILIKTNLYYQDLPIRSHLQVVAAVVHVSPIHPISVCSIYIPPNVSPSKEDLLDIINQLPRPFILCGDLNAHSPLWGSRQYNPRGKALEAIILLEEIHVLNKFECPTYLHPGSGSESVIDFTLCNATLAPKLEWNVYPQDSDHHPIVISVCLNPTPEIDFLPKWKLNKADWAKFTGLAEFSIDENLSVQEQVQEFTDKLLFAATESIPKSKPMNKKYAVAWWNEKCYLAIRERNKAFRVFTKTKSLDNWIAFKRLRAKVKRTVIQSKKESWISFASTITSSTPSTVVWDRIKRIEGNGRSSSVIKSIKVDNKTILVPSEIAHNIGLYFEQKSKERKESFPIAPQTWDFSSDNEERYNKPFTMWELESVLKLLKSQSSPGPDEIHNQMLRHLPNSAKSLLLKIFNKIWKEDEFPDGWKKSILVPIPKPNKDSTLPENLRPINLTSCLCKLFERIVVRRLNYFLDSNKLLVPQQSGCRKNRSTLDNLVNLQTEISNAIINKQFLLCTFFDIKSAYDCTQKEVILRQLHKWNMRGHLPIFLSKYMDPRSFKIRLNNSTLSEDFSIVCGIPQGGVVSGTLFAIAINSITSYIHPSLSSSLFVDDFAIFTRDKNKEVLVSIMQESIDKLENFSNDTGLFFSPQKSQCVLFSRKYKQLNTSINLNMYDTRIEVVDTFKFLGLTFDKKMTWKVHLKNLKQSCLSRSRILKILSKKAWAADRKMLIRIYKSLIRSKLDYGCPVYNSASSNSLQILNPVQNLCLRLATGAFRSSPVVSLEAETGEPNLDIRRKILSSNYIAKTLSIENHPNIMRTLNPLYVRKYENSNMKPTIGIQKKNLETIIPFNNIMVKTTPKEPWLLKPPICDLSLSSYKKENVPAQMFQNEFKNKLAENFQSHIKIYTDGSKNEQGVGCALTIPEKNIAKRFGLNKNASIFHAELFALLQSLLTIKELGACNALIITDSLSCLQAIMNMFHENPLVKRVQEELSSIESSIEFLWCPSHVGIAGNEAADEEAKQAINNDVTHHELSLDEIKTIIKKKYLEEWNTTWVNISPNENKLRKIKNSVYPWKTSNRKSRLDEVCLMRMRVGHSKLTHSHLFRREDQPICDQCQEPMTIEHILISCRKMRFRPPSFSTSNVSHILKDDEETLKEVFQFLKRNNFLKNM
ncbi:hypothetical protein M8J77_012423 [Diaphorina citri]|nr:hypothetical protein M8J77_006766 [Diaphorina citri]KAI5725437.1 hypothetical protein M8J77_015340 [Diaphorina citri]KAI5754894.1 hypothetical protein M8J77_012423 [Diaphorina citri]